MLGGRNNRPGHPTDWARNLAGIQDLQLVLARWTQRRDVRLRIRSHLSAAIGFGRVFNQAAGWRITVPGTDVSTADYEQTDTLRVNFDKGAAGRDLAVEIDLLGVNVSSCAANTLRTLNGPPTNRLLLWREASHDDLLPSQIGSMTVTAAKAIRDAVFNSRPIRIHLFCASPVEFAVHLGHRLTSLHAELHLYERDGGRYLPSLRIPAST